MRSRVVPAPIKINLLVGLNVGRLALQLLIAEILALKTFRRAFPGQRQECCRDWHYRFARQSRPERVEYLGVGWYCVSNSGQRRDQFGLPALALPPSHFVSLSTSP